MTYYRITPIDVGEVGLIHPTGYYKMVAEDGDIVVRWMGEMPFFMKSKVLETCFGKTPHLSLLSIGFIVKPSVYHVYETEETPDVDLSSTSRKGIIDCAFIGEVRYRRPVMVKKLQTITLAEEDVVKIKAIQKEFQLNHFKGEGMEEKIDTLKQFFNGK